jgi:formate hydrogenlyase transcriptional activator
VAQAGSCLTELHNSGNFRTSITLSNQEGKMSDSIITTPPIQSALSIGEKTHDKPDINKKILQNMPPKELDIHLLSLLSLFEGNVSIDWVVALAGEKPSVLLGALQKGVQSKWLTAKEPGIFRFTDLIKKQEFIDRFSPEHLRKQHQKIAEILKNEPLDENTKARLLSHHLFRFQSGPEESRWLIKAGDAYMRAYRSEVALKCYRKVIDDIAGQKEADAEDLFIEAAINYSKVSTARHDTKEVLAILHRALDMAEKKGKHASLALLAMHIAKNQWLCSEYQHALDHFRKGWTIAKEVGDRKLLRTVTAFIPFFLYWQGRFREAVQKYEESVPDVENFPLGRFPLLGAIMVGRCYSLTGQITQGLGMVDAIRIYCLEKGDRHMAAHAVYVMGATMLDIRRVDDAIYHLENSIKEATRELNEWVRIRAKVMLSFAYYLKGWKKKSVEYLREYIAQSLKVNVTVVPYSYLIELCWAIEQGMLPNIPNLSLENSIRRMTSANNVFMKGIAYRFQGLLERKEGAPNDRVITLLNRSTKWLKESGNELELAKSRMELARQHLIIGDEETATAFALKAAEILVPISQDMIPDDIKPLIHRPSSDEELLKKILKSVQQVVTIRDNKDLVQNIISTVNLVTGAERGAIFLQEDGTTGLKLHLRASKNLTSHDVMQPTFKASMKLIEEVSQSGKGRISRSSSKDNISSCICVPMILKDRVMGVLYHDNRLFRNAFQESDLELLDHFAAQAAFALENLRAYEEIERLNQKLSEEKRYYEEQHLEKAHFEEIIGQSPAIKRVESQINQVAPTDTTVLILGETGCGKELVAWAIHRLSQRSEKSFVRVNCSVLPENLISSELFGHEKGAFTGATRRHIGRFELANGGTLFLDEIGELPAEIQVKLLRVLQTGEFERVGGNKTIRSDFRLLAATNRNLEERVKTENFRSDLYYRLNVFPVYIPPLRERMEDIALLASHFIGIYAEKIGKTFKGVPMKEIDKLTQYEWPGNVRELENVIERSAILSHPPEFRTAEVNTGHSDAYESGKLLTLQENERRHILKALQRVKWKVKGKGGAAELLDIHPSTLIFRMKKAGILRPKKTK